MTNSKREYNEFIRANLPYGITYDSARYQYVTFNGKRFVTYLEAKWYIDYLTKFGGFPDRAVGSLFENGEEGVWFEANDSTTLFTDVAGTTPVTTPGDAVALQLDKSGRGNHRTQATTAARPLYALHPVGRVRNELEYTEEFDNAAWSKAVATISANSATAPDDESTADKLVETAALGPHTVKQLRPANAGTYTVQVFLKAGERTRAAVVATKSSGGGTYSVFNLSTGQIDEEGTDFGADVAFVSNSITDVGDGWYLCIIKAELNSATDFGISVNLDNATSGSLSQTYTGDGTSGLFVWGAQLEEGSTATNYQRVGSFLDVSEEGKARRGRIWYNGTSHFMQTGTITPGMDKVQVFAGVRKLSDATAIIFEHSTNVNSNQGSFHLANIETATTHQFVSKGTVTQTAKPISGANAPTTNILTALGDISGDSAILRIDGIQGAINTGDQGTGNYLAYPIYFGARAGTSLFFNGYEDTSIIRFGPNLDDTTISKVESYVASKTPEPTL